MGVKQIGAAIVIGGLAFGYTQYAESGKYADMAKEFQLSKAQQTVMRACNDSLSRHARKFKDDDVDPVRGCACVAQHLTKGIKPANYQAASRVVDLMIERSKRSQSGNVMQQIKAQPHLAKLQPATTMKLFMAANTSVSFCGQSTNLARKAVASVKVPAYVPEK